MTESEINDLDKNWLEWFPNEDLPRLGITRFWALPYNHPCYLAGFLHDIFYPDAEEIVFHYLTKAEVDYLFKLWWNGCLDWKTLRRIKINLKWLRFERCICYRIIKLFKRRFVYNDKKTFNDFGLSDRLKSRIAESQKRNKPIAA